MKSDPYLEFDFEAKSSDESVVYVKFSLIFYAFPITIFSHLMPINKIV